MLLTISQFARHKGLTARHAQRLAAASSWTSIDHHGVLYRLAKTGTYDANGKPIFAVDVPDAPITRRHLSKEEKERLFGRILAGEDGRDLAEEFGISYTTVFKLKNSGKVARQRRADAGSTKADWIPENALNVFKEVYLGNAQRNARYALFLLERELGGVRIPYRVALHWAAQLNTQHMLKHQASKFEQTYTPHIERDLWGEFEFLEQVVFDCWKADLFVKGSSGGKDTQPHLVVAIDLKTRMVLAYKVMAREQNGDDVLDVCLDLVHRWGRPGCFLFDNGTEFTNTDVQRFVRGLWTTEEHEAKERILFSEGYHPQSKGALERLFRICKDEFCAFSSSYSPNPTESRKPTKRLSHAPAEITLGEFKTRFNGYLTTGVFMTRPRSMWCNPQYVDKHERNEGRPRTMAEAVDRAYATHEPVRVDPEKLAFLFARAFKKNLRKGMFAFTHGGVRYRYTPDGIPVERMLETFNVLVNPLDLSQAWVMDLYGNRVSNATDYRIKMQNEFQIQTREQASITRKLRNKAIKHTRDALKLTREIDGLALVSRPMVSPVNPPLEESAVEAVYADMPTESPEVSEDPIDEDYVRGYLQAMDDDTNINQ